MSKSDNERRVTTDTRRKRSGLIEKKLYFDAKTREQLNEVATRCGYDTTKISNEEYSQVISYCIASQIKHSKISVPLTRAGQELLKIHEVLKYRESVGSSVSEMVEFMKSSKYEVPKATPIPKKLRINRSINSPVKSWTAQVVTRLLNEEKVSTKISKLNARYEKSS